MKFISGIKKAKIESGEYIEIPIYHRTSISFFNGSEVYYHYRNYESNGFNIREIILTPLKPEIWHHLRRVTLNAIDRPGIINAITSQLRDLKVNVNIVEALTTELGALHTITLIIDISIYIEKHPQKFKSGDAIPKDVIDEIENILKALKYPNTKEPVVFNEQVYIKELTFLESISNTYTNEKSTRSASFQFHNSHNQKVIMTKGKIQLTDTIVTGLSFTEDVFYYTMFSDTEEKYIKILFFDPNQTVAFIDILHQDVYGAISKFTEIIHSKYEFNILASYSHQQMQKVKAQWYALIDISNKKKEFFTKTLDTLRLAEYGEENDKKKVLEVFLIESNMDSIPEDAIKRFGQNKKTLDEEFTTVYLKKRKILEGLISDYSVKSYLKSPKEFVERYNLHGTNSLKRSINGIIKQKNERKNKTRALIIRKALAIIVPLLVVLLLVVKFNILGEKMEEHALITLIIGGLVLLGLFVDRGLKQFFEKDK